MTTINYVRWSADDHIKVESSRQNFLNLKTIKDNNIKGEIIYVEEKGVSGKVPVYDRPKLGPLLKKLPKDTKIIVSDLSRLGRLDYDLISFRDERTTNLIISDKPTLTKDENRVMFVLEATMSDKYRRDLSEKQRQKCEEMQASITDKGYYITKSTNRKNWKFGNRQIEESQKSDNLEIVTYQSRRIWTSRYQRISKSRNMEISKRDISKSKKLEILKARNIE